MRRTILHPSADKLIYAIREIVEHATRLQSLGVSMTWENIGDPVQKGEPVPDWIKEAIAALAHQDASYGYSPTRGLNETRAFLAERVNARGGARLGVNDILFFNGLGDAVSRLFAYLHREARVLLPSPSYTSHSTSETVHAGAPALCYELDPRRGWQPDLEAIARQVRDTPEIAGILVINPDNPTGVVHTRENLAGIVRIARENDLFVVFDEIYINLTYGDAPPVHLGDLLGDVPGISLKGISKEFPWPGSRCGWMEFYNQDKDPAFARFARSLFDAKMVEVCSTTLPQRAIPLVMGDPRYAAHLRQRSERYRQRAEQARAALADVPGITVNLPRGAFYFTVVFDEGALDREMTLPIADPRVRSAVDALAANAPQPDYRFVYYLMGATGIVAVPLTSFYCRHQGFRITLLESDDRQRAFTLATLARAIRDYLGSTAHR